MNSSKKNIFNIILIIGVVVGVISGLLLYIINNQKQRTVKEMANKILSSAECYAISQIMEGNITDVIVKFPDNEILDIKGNLPNNGYVKITSNSEIEIRYYYNGYCVSKSFNEFDTSFKKINKDKCLNQ